MGPLSSPVHRLTCSCFRQLPLGHRVAVLQTIELILLSRIDEIGCLRVKSIVSLASDEMTRSKVMLVVKCCLRIRHTPLQRKAGMYSLICL